MTPLLRAELLKLRTTRTFVALIGSALALSLILVVLNTLLTDDFSEREVREAFTGDFTGLFILLLGVIGMAGEWRHRTVTGTVLAAPVRVRLLGAKLLSYALAGAVVSLIVTLAIMVIGTAILSSRDLTTIGVGEMADVLWRNLVVSAFFGAVGVCIGGLIRNQVVAMVGLLVFSFALEPALVALLSDIGKFGPTSGAPNGFLEISFGDEEALSPALSLLVMAGWIVAGFAATAALLRRRDLV